MELPDPDAGSHPGDCEQPVVARIGPRRLVTRSSSFVETTYKGTTVRFGLCTWSLPTGARGKTVRGTIVASYEDAAVSRNFVTKVR
jgi:hypothetical protein